MTTKQSRIEVNGLPVEVLRKNIKNLHLAVYPPDGRIRVAAPSRLSDDAIRLALISRLSWIKRRQARFQQQDRQSQREMVMSESHYLHGRRYRLDVIEHPGPGSVRVRNNQWLEMRVPHGSTRQSREAILHRWYRDLLRRQLEELLPKWQNLMGVDVAECAIKKMKTRWGTCNASARRIWLNLELAKKPQSCLEYILVHEMVHLLERRHNERFKTLIDKYMPQWRLYRDQLNSFPLAHENWTY